MTWQPNSFARRLALELPFLEISRSLAKIDQHERKTADPGCGVEPTSSEGGFFGRLVSSIKHSFWYTEAFAAPPSDAVHSSTDEVKPRAKNAAVLLEEGKGRRKGGHSSDSSDVSDSELLGPDGKLPYSVPSDVPNAYVDLMRREDKLELTVFFTR